MRFEDEEKVTFEGNDGTNAESRLGCVGSCAGSKCTFTCKTSCQGGCYMGCKGWCKGRVFLG